MQTQMQKPLTFAAAVCLAACTAANAQDLGDQGRGYGRFDVGVNLLNDVDLDSFDGVNIPGSAEIEFDTGVRFDIAAGYKLTDSFNLELEIGFAYNSADELSGSIFGYGEDIDFSDMGVDINLYQVPMLVNLSYTFPISPRFRPFVGVGAGGVAATTTVDLGYWDDCETVFAFAYQAFAGINYRVSDDMDIGIIYKYFGTTDLDFDLFETDGLGAHMVGLNFEYRF